MTPVILARVADDERELAIDLAVAPEQRGFVATNAYSLDQAAQDPACVPLLIRADGEPVGFAMYALDPDDKNYWIYRFMIDARFQRKGFGQAALDQLTALIFSETGCPCIRLGVKPANAAARRLYERAGFVDIGFHFDGEDTLELRRSPA